MISWNKYRFGELVHFPPRIVLRKGEDYPFIDMDVINPYNRHVENMQRKKYESSSCSKFAHGDVLLARITPCLENGKIAQVKTANSENGFGSTEFFVFRAKSNLLDQSFLFYLAKSDLVWKSAVNSMVGASGRQRADATFLKGVELRIPKPPEQRKIAALLSAYDELIENNQRRIALLEKMTEEVYREWFVRLRFPGHDKVKLVKGVPQGWRVVELKELASVNPSSNSRRGNPESIIYVDISSVSTNRIDDVTPYISAEAPGRARRRVKHGDVIWSSVRPANRAYCLIYEPPDNLIVSTGFAVIRPNAATPFTFLFFAVTSNPFVDQMTTVAKGAAYPATSFDDFEKAKLLVPSDDLLTRFHEKTEPLFRQKHLLQQQSVRLRQTRDLLLPRLISGKLSVENLDIRFPSSMVEKVEP